MFKSTISLAALAVALPFQPALAEVAVTDASAEAAGATAEAAEAAEAAEPQPGSAAQAHGEREEQLVVTGVRRRASDVLGGVSVLDKAELTREVRTSIGETLARQPGVSATSFGPTASAPVLRGLSGDRVRVLTDGIGTLDLSSSGPDHAISINPITAERIEVLRGPAALLFGSSAIGGVVNVIDTRIPRRLPENAVGVDVLLGYGTAANERLGQRRARHSDRRPVRHPCRRQLVEDRRSADRRPHPVGRAARRRARQPAIPDIQALADLKGDLPNSKSKSKEGALGFAYVGDNGLNLGVSVTRHEQKYQVPIRYSLDPAAEAEAPTIDLEQTRYDARAEIPLGGFFSQVRARGGYSDYHHDEIEDTGEIGSSFFSKGGEGRRRAGPDGEVGLGRHQRHPISRAQRQDPRRGEIPARQRPEAGRPVHRADPGPRPMALRGRRPHRVQQVDRRGRRAARHALAFA